MSGDISEEAVRVLRNVPGARTASLLYEGGKEARLLSGGIEGGWVGEEGCLEGRELGFSPGKLGEDGEG